LVFLRHVRTIKNSFFWLLWSFRYVHATRTFFYYIIMYK
jgi:hypothetical protein